MPVAMSEAEAELDSRDWRVCTVWISCWPWLRFSWMPFTRMLAASERALSGDGYGRGTAVMMRGRKARR